MKKQLQCFVMLMLFVGSLIFQGVDLHADAGDQVKLCHVTGQAIDAENGKCRGFVMAVARSAAQGHLIHGDVIPPNQDDFTVGDEVVMNCAP